MSWLYQPGLFNRLCVFQDSMNSKLRFSEIFMIGNGYINDSYIHSLLPSRDSRIVTKMFDTVTKIRLYIQINARFLALYYEKAGVSLPLRWQLVNKYMLRG